MGFACPSSADKDDVALLSDEAAAGEIANQAFVDWRILEGEVVDVFGERQLGDRELVFDRARLLLGDLGLEQIADEALRLVFALERCCERLVIGVLHAVKLELAHQVEDFRSLHGHALLKLSYLAQSAIGAWRSLSASGVKIGATGPGSRRRARMFKITSAEWTPSARPCAQAASTADSPSVSAAARIATICRSP